MSTPFQNRLVGTIIVAAAVIILLPDLLDGEKKSYQADFEAIPKPPVLENQTIAKPFPTDSLEALPKEKISDEQAVDSLDSQQLITEVISAKPSVTESTKSVSKVNITPVKRATDKLAIKPKVKVATTVKSNLPAKAVVGKAWVIHLGSFRHKKNVELLVKKLKNNGYLVFTRPIKTKNGLLTKVFIGPELIKSTLEKKLPTLKQLTNVQGKVARFYPSN